MKSARRNIFFWAPDGNIKTPHEWVVLGSEGWVRVSGSASVKNLFCNYCREKASENNRHRHECLSDFDKYELLKKKRRLSDQTIAQSIAIGFNAGGSTEAATPEWNDESDTDGPHDYAMYPRYWEDQNRTSNYYSEAPPDSEASVDELFDHQSDGPNFGDDDEGQW